MSKYMFCPLCEEEREVEIKDELESYPVKNEQTEISARVTYCSQCGEKIWNDELESENLLRAYSKYRSKHHLLQPEEIKEIREKYSLTQTSFAKILGFGEKTITRYENGSIQDAAQNNLMMLCKHPDIIKELLILNKDQIADSDFSRVMDVVNSFE